MAGMEIRSRLSAFGARAMVLVPVLIMGVFLAACSKEAPRPGTSAGVVDSTVAATVGGQPIYVSDVQLEAEAQGVTEAGKQLEFDSAEFNRVLDQLIDIKLLAQEAVGRQLDQDPQARHRLDAAREHILGNILVEQVVAERVDEAAIKKMYDSQVAIWELGEEVHVRHIVSATKEDADKVLAKLQSGTDFAVLASKESTDQATRLEGGDMGWMTEEEAPPELQKVIKSTPVGGISKPFQTAMGWHVAKIEERRKEQPPTMEQMRDPILKHLTTLQIGDVLKELRTKAKIQKMNSPQNAPIDIDPFAQAPVIPDNKVAPPPPLEASATRPGVSDTRTPEPAPAATAAVTAKPGAAPEKAPAAAKAPDKASAKAPVKTAAPAKPPATATPTSPSPSPTPSQPPAASPSTPPSGPVGESRQGATP
jgi:peptidyl-prolyl cis-trans isomerase C